MKRILRKLLSVSLSLLISNHLTAESTQETESLIAELSQEQNTEKSLPTDTDSLEELSNEAAKGNPHAEKLWADVLIQTDDSNSVEKAKALYEDAAQSGVPTAHLGLAKVLLDETQSEENNSEVTQLLQDASALGSSEADRLLSETLSQSSSLETQQEAWKLLEQAAERGDAQACTEVAQAYQSGSWTGLQLTVNETKAEEFLREASNQNYPEAALKLSMLLSQDGSETTQEDYQQSVEQLYYAYLWAHENGNTELIEQINQLGETNAIYPRTYIKAHYLYEKTILPEIDTETKTINGTLEVKTRNGTFFTQKIAGAEDQTTLTLLAFPYDSQYLWDGEVTVENDGTLSVSAEDVYWASLSTQKEPTIPYYVKVLSGEYSGEYIDVASDWFAGDDRQIALTNNELLPGQTVQIALGQWRSLFSLFGQYNKVGLKPATSADKADQIILLDSANQQVEKLFFNSELLAWVTTDNPDVAALDIAIAPWQALFVLRREEAPLYLTKHGVYSNAENFLLPIDPGINLLANVEGEILEKLASDEDISAVRADEISVFTLKSLKKNSSEDSLQEDINWWDLLGISADTPVYVNPKFAFIFAEEEQAEPYTLQR